MLAVYKPKIGDTLIVFHPDGLFTDSIIGTVKEQQYKVVAIDPAETYGIKLLSKRGNRDIYSDVEPDWFNTQLTGRRITIL